MGTLARNFIQAGHKIRCCIHTAFHRLRTNSGHECTAKLWRPIQEFAQRKVRLRKGRHCLKTLNNNCHCWNKGFFVVAEGILPLWNPSMTMPGKNPRRSRSPRSSCSSFSRNDSYNRSVRSIMKKRFSPYPFSCSGSASRMSMQTPMHAGKQNRRPKTLADWNRELNVQGRMFLLELFPCELLPGKLSLTMPNVPPPTNSTHALWFVRFRLMPFWTNLLSATGPVCQLVFGFANSPNLRYLNFNGSSETLSQFKTFRSLTWTESCINGSLQIV